jgi:hypothetical protein
MPLFPVFGDLLHAEVEYYHVRAGLSLIDGFYGPVYTFLPVSVGYTVYERPVHYSDRLHGMVPEVALRFSGYWLNNTGDLYTKVPIAGRLDAVAGVDLIGFGLSLSAGVIGACTFTNRSGSRWDGFAGVSPNVELRLRALTFGADLGR